MRGFDLLGQQVALQVGMAPYRVGLRVVEDQDVVRVCEAGDRAHAGVGQLLRPGRGVELAAYQLTATGVGPGPQKLAHRAGHRIPVQLDRTLPGLGVSAGVAYDDYGAATVAEAFSDQGLVTPPACTARTA